MKEILCRYPFSLLAVLAITILSLIPVPEIKPLEDVPLMDKWVHMLMYGILSSILWWEYLCAHSKKSLWCAVFPTILLPILLGGAMELAQRYLTTCRSGEWLDFFANSIGVIVAILPGLIMRYFLKRRS